MALAEKLLLAVATATFALYAGTALADDAQGKIYIDKDTGSDINFVLQNLASNASALPTNALISKSSGDYIEYSVSEQYADCENNLKMSFCAYDPAAYNGKNPRNCKSSRTQCGAGDITTLCYFGTSNVDYCNGKLECVDTDCDMGNLPGGFSFAQGDSGTNKLTFKISR